MPSVVTSDYAAMGLSQNCFFLIASYRMLLDSICPFVIEGILDKTEMAASDRQPLSFIPIHFVRR